MDSWDQCKAGGSKDTSFVVPWPPCAESVSSFQCHSYNPWSMRFGGIQEDRSGASASRSHSQAEKRRRDRINAQLATLRELIPKSDKMDKAALLGSVVEHVKDLKRKALEVSKTLSVPSDVDEVTIDCFSDVQDGSSTATSTNNIYIKASVCCDDRPELFSELTQALKGLKLKTVQADVASLGGRIKSILVLCSNKDNKEVACLNTLVQSLRGVLSRIAGSSSSMGSSYRMKSKRQRFFLHSH
ncbi:transcription factor bHLH51 [Rhododendron vialii]|uniref:transcription factor bHLH51 n=1 Tax=Rhododendron vialii TaxID=182163 RepID=UPI00265DB057|nr:transcription factor bHLH51 [Rhododendron vialii]XP_058207288.1 transcription factor bHLH51 [Rhododendron vialii]